MIKSLLILLFFSPLIAFGTFVNGPRDTPCETIYLVSGNFLLGRIYYEDRTIVRYWHCNEAVKTKHEIAMFQVDRIGYGSDHHNQPVVEDRSRLNNRGIYWIVTIGVALLLAVLLVLLLL